MADREQPDRDRTASSRLGSLLSHGTIDDAIQPSSERLATLVLLAAAAAAAAALLFASFAAFTWGKSRMNDYGIYTNMMWNCGHGDWFRLLVTDSYLRIHLSFTLALFGIFFRVADHPFLLGLLQWGFLAAGAGIVWATARRHAVKPPVGAAIVLCLVAHPFSQAALLSDFHGVSLYLALIPWLCFCLAFRRRLAWLPLVLILGVREEAGLTAIPILLYFARTRRWRAGYVLAGAAAVYVALALTVLFPVLTDTSLAAARPHLSWSRMLDTARQADWAGRGVAVFWVLLPALPFLRHGWKPLVTFLAVPLLTAFFSPYPTQGALAYHYAAPVMACLAAALAEAAAPARCRAAPAAAFLAASVLAAHLCGGYLWGGRNTDRAYTRLHPDYAGVMKAVRHIPKQGVLLCHRDLAGFCANRADLLSWRYVDPERHHIDHAFMRLRHLTGRDGRAFREWIEGKTFGVTFFDGDRIVMTRGMDTGENRAVLDALALGMKSIRFAVTAAPAGENVAVPGCPSARFWAGRGPPAVIAAGVSKRLPAGSYQARFRLRCEPLGEAGTGPGQAGMLDLCAGPGPAPIASAPITPADADQDGFFEQTVAFQLENEADVEPRVSGGAARLWLDRVVFETTFQP